MNEGKPTRLAQEQSDRINKILKILAIEYYTIAPILYRMQMKPTYEIESMGVDSGGRGVFNPAFTESLTENELKFVLLHETYHVLLKHLTRFDSWLEQKFDNPEKGKQEYHFKFNTVSDSYINENLKKTKNITILDDSITFQDISKHYNVTEEQLNNSCVEDILDLIFEQDHKENDNSQEDKEQTENSQTSENLNDNDNLNNDSNSSSNEQTEEESNNNSNKNDSNEAQTDSKEQDSSSKDHTENETQNSEYNENSNSKQFKNILENDLNVQEEIEKVYGEQEPDSEIERIASKICHNRKEFIIGETLKRNNINWEKVLDDFVYKTSNRTERAKSWRRPNRYYREIYPITKGRMKCESKDVVFSIDSSGSINPQKVAKIIDVFNSFIEKYSVNAKYFFFNDKMSEVYEYAGKDKFLYDFEKNYGGGTVFECAIRNGEVENYGGLVIISDDGFSNSPKEIENYLCNLSTPLINVDIAPYETDPVKNTFKEQLGDKYICL